MQPEKPSVPSLIESIRNLTSLAFWPIVGSLFHPTYLIVNAATCDRLGGKYLAGFGLGSLTLGILTISIVSCYSGGIGTLAS